jgi:arsenate reductase
MRARIYHNPRCRKSRATLALLEARGIAVDVVDYLKTPPSRKDLAALARKLGGDVAAMVRTNEPEYRAAFPAGPASADALLDLLAAQPKLLQRPIVVVGDAARIGRPPERVLEICA